MTEEIATLIKQAEKKCEDKSYRVRRAARILRGNLLKGKRIEVPSIQCVAHKYRHLKKGFKVSVLWDTGCSFTVIPLEMVERLGIMVNEEDADYDLLNASGDQWKC